MSRHPIPDPRAVDVTYWRLTSSRQASYSGAKILPSGATHDPPESARMRGLTARMYAIVKKVTVPALTSVVKVLLRPSSSKNLPNLDREILLFKLSMLSAIVMLDVAVGVVVRSDRKT